MLTLKDVLAGNTYYAEYDTDLGNYAIINCDKDCSLTTSSGGIQISKKKYWISNGWSCKNNIRLATDEEKAWLEHCIKEDKFVEYEQFMKVYKPQFIVGKWYKIELSHTYNHFIKFKSFDDINGYIDNLGYIKDLNKFATGNSLTLKSITKYELLTDLSEIQKFLPLDHPDKQLDIKQIQEECKKRFPIGCKFKNTEGEEEEFTLIQDHSVYKIVGNNVIWASSGYGYLYDKGKYAELIETPEEVIPEYVEYIDTLYKGTIVKVEDWCCGSYCKVIFYNGNKEQPFKHLVKYSTKSAYDLQNLKQLPLTPEQCYNTEIEVGDEVENIAIQHYNGAVCTENNNYTEKGIKGIVTKKGYSVGADCIAYEITWHNGKKCGKSINQVKLIKKANKNTTTTLNKKVDVSSPKVTDKITVPRINTTSYDTLVHINIETNTKSIKIPKLETNTPEIKKIKIQSLTLTI